VPAGDPDEPHFSREAAKVSGQILPIAMIEFQNAHRRFEGRDLMLVSSLADRGSVNRSSAQNLNVRNHPIRNSSHPLRPGGVGRVTPCAPLWNERSG